MNRYRHLVLIALLTFLLVITVLPATAELSSKSKIFKEVISQKAPLRRLPRLVNSQNTTVNSSVALLKQGKQFYDQGQFTLAAKTWEKALEELKQLKELYNQALCYNYLAIVYQDLGKWEAAQNAITQSLEILNHSQQVGKIPASGDSVLLFAQVFNTQGSLQLHTGHPEVALETWKQAEVHYRSVKDITGIVLVQINQGSALQTLGLYRKARSTLEQVSQDLTVFPDSLLKARGLRSLGMTLQVVGDLQQSQTVLSKSLAIAKQLNSTIDVGEALLCLGNTARASLDSEAALKFYQQAFISATNPHTQLQALLNQLSLLVKTNQRELALALRPQIQAYFANLPPSRAVIYARVNFAESLIKIEIAWGLNLGREIAQLLALSVQQARQLNDPRAESYALGQLGYLYEQTQQWSEAFSLTQQALALAQGIGANDIAASWYWQQGRILRAQGNVTAAIVAYEQAINTLQSLRQDLVALNPDVQFSFRDEVEPVHRQLVQLLLKNVDSLPKDTKQKHLQRSREVIEALQVAELDNYFREACLTYKPRSIEAMDSKAAIIFSILLEGRLEVILSFYGEPLQHYGTDLSEEKAIKVFEELRSSLNPLLLPKEVLPNAQQVYDWLLRPFTAELEHREIQTLVFVLDNFLRSLPMAALHDGKQYLVERYNIALTPGLRLFESRTLINQQLSALVGGLTEARQGYSALPSVKEEIDQITTIVTAKALLNEKFTRSNFQKRVENQPFSIVHLATHGEFSSKAEDTFLLAWDERINVKDLEQFLKGQGKSATLREREPIELLVLSACQTAKGDNRVALGLAGVAIRSGARSILATLWSVEDNSTAQLISKFYHLLIQKGVTKAEALRKSQLSLLKSAQYNHPYYWAPFVLVGNWR